MYTGPMYLAVDIGGSKTLLAVFSPRGELVKKYKLATDKNYTGFKTSLRQALAKEFGGQDFRGCCCAAPGLVDRSRGVVLSFGNLSWKDTPLKQDLQQLLGDIPVWVENDANLAGLSEALLVHDKYKKVLYLTIGTGIGDGIIIDGVIDPTLADSEPGHMLVEHGGALRKWENLASGKALVDKYGKIAAQIDDPQIWKSFAHRVALGLNQLIATVQPEVVIIGGGVGVHFQKFEDYLKHELASDNDSLVNIPPIIKAKKPEEAVVYGCYEFIRQRQN